MAPNPRVTAAYRAMTVLGIKEVKVKPVLKQLLKLYDKNWELIEQENYRALADAIFEQEEKELQGKRKKNQDNDEGEMEDEEAQMQDESVRPLKRLRLRGQENQASQPLSICGTSSAASPSKIPKVEDDKVPERCSHQQPQYKAMSPQSNKSAETEVRPAPVRDSIVNKGKQPLSPQAAPGGRRFGSERASPSVPCKEPTAERRIVPLQKDQLPYTYALIKPKDEPIDELVDYDAPIAAILPELPGGRDPPMQHDPTRKQDRNGSLMSKCGDDGRGKGIRDSSDEANHEVATNQECSTIEIASSTSGEVKITMSCSSAPGRSEFRLPSRDQLLKMMEDKCLQSYNITDPNFSITKLLRDMCDCVLEFRTDSNDDSQEGSEMMTSSLVLKESQARDALNIRGNTEDLGMHAGTSNGSINIQSSSALVASRISTSPPLLSGMNGAIPVTNKAGSDFPECGDGKGLEDPTSPHLGSLVVVQQHQLTPDDLRSLHGAEDLSKGEENLRIPWVNEITNDFPPPFHYLHQSIGFRDAYVNWCLSNIKCEDYCSTCLGDCLLSPASCVCANKTEGGYAYTSEGLLKEKFLEECITISRNPQQHQFYCRTCPLERAKNDDCLEPCKGHLKRKFIKECWVKCGCVKQCGNRVVQRGITFKLQVFFTSEGKGWGLRTLEELPKGAFVCEFVGEILTLKELHERNMQCAQNGTYTYPVLLDADWDSGVITDKEALCLDAASYGNIARFINHRCLDANLIEIPVEVETSDHHYFHLAFFTSRKVAALEELTWDYGIDFDDNEGPVKPFSCRCGSKFCRKMKRSTRSNRSASVA
ncbi:probable inactive histone-lysine N-methyltransferase SUVR2 isoform X1 [Neltuma alba]|uniref:probable inactive histone-lysine N-methyltransferase SUVR2 isoform X1 n=1 Tax=Neltuma alba TaxID=207710 RepID=UPI0010A420FA|nr:probable inactive histone-lysine N-methyltransferase SUVR2 isoform X1 [Prosopis alba]XP_028758275.1 probable inactive histone-lysine N-methyltransferase SUVR2 isoform X1 [Prosopis alba]